MKNIFENRNKKFFFSKPLIKKQKKFYEKDYKIFEKKIISKITKALNRLHSVNYSERFWRILLGHWLLYFISTAYRHYSSLRNPKYLKNR